MTQYVLKLMSLKKKEKKKKYFIFHVVKPKVQTSSQSEVSHSVSTLYSIRTCTASCKSKCSGVQCGLYFQSFIPCLTFTFSKIITVW